jgi:predicted HAD superfamily Cof-like phosphohydrolase
MDKKFEEAKALTGVSEFHSLFELPVVDIPKIPSVDRCNLRVSLLQEELDELKDAIETNDIVAAADAFSDIQYVLSGAILEFGLGAKFADLFAEVQKSNMSKACKSYDEALASQAWYLENKNTESSIVERDGQYLLYRKSDLKVLKSINYYAADFEKILNS